MSLSVKTQGLFTKAALSVIQKKVNTGIVVDFNADGVAVGIEIVAPSKVTVNEINDLLNELKIDPISEVEFAPLKAA